MDRRKFNTSLIVGLAGYKMAKMKVEAKAKILPLRLQPGDLIGLVAPAGQMTEMKVANSIDKLESYGFRVKEGNYLRNRHGYLAGTDEERLEDLHEMYKDPAVKGIWCARGGYGITRLLDRLDFRLIRKNPKVLIGFSDITALLNSIYQRTGIVGFHGPLGASVDNAFTRTILRDLTMHPEKKVVISPFYPVDASYDDIVTINPGREAGIAVGGNLTLLSAMTGTPYEVRFKDKIVFLEDVGEAPYRIDRMLTQLVQATDLSKSRGIVLGQFKGCHPKDPDTSLSLLEVIKDRLKHLALPCVYGLNFGHVDHNFTFPIGGEVDVNFSTGVIAVTKQVVG